MARSNTPRIVVGESSPYRIWLGVFLVLVCSLSIGLFALDYLKAQTDRRHQQSLREREALEARIGELQDLNTGLHERIAVLERERKIDREVREELQETYDKSLSELARLRKRIVFYDSVMSPQEGRPGLRLHSFHLEPIEERVYDYELIISQVSKDYRLTKGTVDLGVEGVFDGGSKRLSWADVSDQAGSGLPYEFKYFQDFRGVLKLPEGFSPRELVVTLTPEGKSKGKLFRQVWPTRE